MLSIFCHVLCGFRILGENNCVRLNVTVVYYFDHNFMYKILVLLFQYRRETT
jgi:hypothetical protein